MGWFDEQIRQRMQSDQETLEDTFARMVNVVLDNWGMDQLRNEREVTREALDDILKYYHQKPSDIPEKIKDPAEQIEYALRPTGIMTREVHLEEGWQQDAYGPFREHGETGGYVAHIVPAFSLAGVRDIKEHQHRVEEHEESHVGYYELRHDEVAQRRRENEA